MQYPDLQSVSRKTALRRHQQHFVTSGASALNEKVPAQASHISSLVPSNVTQNHTTFHASSLGIEPLLRTVTTYHLTAGLQLNSMHVSSVRNKCFERHESFHID